jgi:hypothetical protein
MNKVGGINSQGWMAIYMQQQRFAKVKRAGLTPGAPVFPDKAFYFTDFSGIANSTTLRSLPGWAAYNSASSTSVVRDQWQVQSNAVTRTNVSTDFATKPGLFVVGRDAGSTDHVYKCKLTTLPSSGNALLLVVAATAENNCVFLEVVNSSGVMQSFILRKNVAGTLTLLLTQAGSTSNLGRALQVGDDIELHVIGQYVHLFVNNKKITPPTGTDLNQGGAFTKGAICGHGSGQGSFSVFDDEYFAALTASLTFTPTEIFWPGSVALGGRVVPITGTYTGDVQALDYRVVNDATGAVVRDWARINGATIAAGAWSGGVFVAMCDTTVNPKVRIQVRAANETDAKAISVATTVGIGVGSYGQSNSAFRGQGTATSHSVANAYTWSQDSSSVWQGGAATTTTRSQLWATQLAARSGIPCGVFVFGVGSQTLANLTSRGAGFFDELEAAAASSNATGYIQSWLWTQGEAESAAAGVFDLSTYRSTFDTLLSQLRASISESITAPVGVCVIGTTTGGHVSGTTFGDSNWSAVRAGLFGLRDKTGVYVATHLTDATLVDSLHYTADAYVENGRRAGLSMAAALGYGGYNGRGPLITGATRSGAVITLPIDLNGAASIAGTGLTNYQVTLDGFATTLTISTAEVSGGNIVLTMAADPGAAVQVRSFYGMTYTAPVRAIGTYAGAPSLPVEPLFVPVTSS